MGVHGLWRLIEPSGKPVPLETLENKVLAVDISIWLHQAIKGFKDGKGSVVPNAHLLGVYHRVCKLLYFKIKPVFVFDGGVPVLKKQTIAKRNLLKSRSATEAERIRQQLINVLLRHSAVNQVLSEKTKATLSSQVKKTTKDDMFFLPTPAPDAVISSSSEEEEEDTTTETDSSPTKQWDLHTIDPLSKEFQSLPIEMKHEILTELIATRKQSSWGRLHELPKQSDDFSAYQMKRLLKRQTVQSTLDSVSKEMGGNALSLAELEALLEDQGVLAKKETVGKRIASDENTRFLYIRDIREAVEKAKQEEAQKEEQSKKSQADLEEEEDLQKAIALSLQEEPSTSEGVSGNRKDSFSFFEDADFISDLSEDDEEVPTSNRLRSAESYMIEYSGLTRHEVQRIIGEEIKVKDKRYLKGERKFSMKEPRVEVFQSTSVNSTNLKHKNDEDEELQKAIALSLQDNTSDKAESLMNSSSSRSSNSQLEKNSITKNVIGTSNNLSMLFSTNIIDVENQLSLAENNTKVTPRNDKSNNVENKQVLTEECSIPERESEEKVKIVADDKIVDYNVEVISDSEDSNPDDFLDVSSECKKENYIEVKIDPTEEVDDDLFADVFTKDTENSNIVDTRGKEDVSKADSIAECITEKNDASLHKNEGISAKEDTRQIKSPCDKQLITHSVDVTVQSANLKDTSKAGPLKITSPEMSMEKLKELEDSLQQEKQDLQKEQLNKERQAVNITDQMYQEAQELLELFGVPYIVAPMEAEAQCAFLDIIGLTDGTITDDSDIWLFGGKTVYKNFFNQSKYVMEFRAEDIKHHFKLTREQMILLALLVGSDYTIGISGIGPVTALEILATFPPASQSNEFSLTHNQLLTGLKEFKAWFSKGKSAGPGRSSLKNKLKSIHFTDNFPSAQVIKAYLEPSVEKSNEKFSWAKPDFIALTVFARDKFGWNSKKTEEILKPVIKRIEESQIQKTIKDYFKTKFKAPSDKAQDKMSKRVKTAVDRIGKTPEELLAEEMELLEKEKEKKLKKAISKNKSSESKKKAKKGKLDENDDVKDAVVSEEESSTSKRCKSITKSSRGRRNQKSKEVVSKGSKNGKLKAECELQLDENKQDSGSEPTKTETKASSRKNHTTKSEPNSRKRKSSDADKLVVSEPKQSVVEVNRSESLDVCEENTESGPIGIANEKIDKDPDSKTEDSLDENDIRYFENLAAEIRYRRQIRNNLAPKEDKKWKKRPLKKSNKPPEEELKTLGVIPEDLKKDVEVQHLMATASTSTEKVADINMQVQEELSKEITKVATTSEQKNKENDISTRIRGLHGKEIIHQKLKENKDLLRNKMKAIEIYRKTKLGQVMKKPKKKMQPKEDADLSEDSD